MLARSDCGVVWRSTLLPHIHIRGVFVEFRDMLLITEEMPHEWLFGAESRHEAKGSTK